ncbi:uncharacterized protein CLUP02_03850 [Colletotrichum lupini]|uniref:Uncharacterized protein n=1 Tax=Colletotrichum lupini TaxID=145971 RepID=A0A9Q8SJM2_9PEZI|nr:uncharacterized protein CLUP02_03850 [Colletotrichum lupini]UQC78373.1 hypothetical protein CLUP02_03850 [Colletotrichum lupini]
MGRSVLNDWKSCLNLPQPPDDTDIFHPNVLSVNSTHPTNWPGGLHSDAEKGVYSRSHIPLSGYQKEKPSIITSANTFAHIPSKGQNLNVIHPFIVRLQNQLIGNTYFEISVKYILHHDADSQILARSPEPCISKAPTDSRASSRASEMCANGTDEGAVSTSILMETKDHSDNRGRSLTNDGPNARTSLGEPVNFSLHFVTSFQHRLYFCLGRFASRGTSSSNRPTFIPEQCSMFTIPVSPVLAVGRGVVVDNAAPFLGTYRFDEASTPNEDGPRGERERQGKQTSRPTLRVLNALEMESSAPTATSPDQPLTPKPHVGCKILAVDTQPCRSREQKCSGSPSSPTNTPFAPAGPRGHTERQERSQDIEMGKEGGNKETVVKERDAADPSATGKLGEYAPHSEESALQPAVAFLYSNTQFSKTTIKGVELYFPTHSLANKPRSDTGEITNMTVPTVWFTSVPGCLIGAEPRLTSHLRHHLQHSSSPPPSCIDSTNIFVTHATPSFRRRKNPSSLTAAWFCCARIFGRRSSCGRPIHSLQMYIGLYASQPRQLTPVRIDTSELANTRTYIRPTNNGQRRQSRLRYRQTAQTTPKFQRCACQCWMRNSKQVQIPCQWAMFVGFDNRREKDNGNNGPTLRDYETPHKGANSVKNKIRWPVSAALCKPNNGFPELWNGMMEGTHKLLIPGSEDNVGLFLNSWF